MINLNLKMDKTIEVLQRTFIFKNWQTNAAMLDLIKVEVYGQQMPINQVGSITTPEPRMINIQIWDQIMCFGRLCNKKIRIRFKSSNDGQLIRLHLN